MEQPLKVCLAHPEWQFAQILTLHDEHIERAELDFLPTRMESIEVGDTITPSATASSPITNRLTRFFLAACTIQGKR